MLYMFPPDSINDFFFKLVSLHSWNSIYIAAADFRDAVTMPACSHQLMLQYGQPSNISNLAKPESLLQGTLTQYKL